LKLVSEFSLVQQWPTFFGIAVSVMFLASANLFGMLWGWVMRKRRVLREYTGSWWCEDERRPADRAPVRRHTA